MDKNFRLQTLIKLAGTVQNFVAKQLVSETTSRIKPVSYQRTMNVPGAVVDIPANPFGSNGEVNFMFVFRYVKDTRRNAGIAGINTVVVYSDTGKQYGEPQYISRTIGAVLGELKKLNPNAKLGKYGMTAFSGGYYPVEQLLNRKRQLVAAVGKEPDAVILADAGHTILQPATMNGFMEYAKEAADPNTGKKFVVVHSAIKPVRGPSTTAHSQYILDRMGLTRQQVTPGDQRFSEWDPVIQPRSVASSGNFSVIQADDQGNRRYSKGNEPGTSGWVHFQIAKTIPYIWQQNLQDWNS